MPVTVFNYGGTAGWYIRKYMGSLSSKYWYRLQYILRNKPANHYITYFNTLDRIPDPLSIAVETLNRCNGTCPFCPANVRDEQRPRIEMTDDMFEQIVQELSVFQEGKPFSGRVLLSINNEPFMDKKIIERERMLRVALPQAFIQLYTNGTLLTVETMEELAPLVDLLIVDNYSMEMKLNKPVQAVYDHMRRFPERFKDIQVTIQMRYANEILSNRNGTAPNKKGSPSKEISALCMLPFTDLNIFPDGTAGLCCNDTREVSYLGSIEKNTLQEIWQGSDPRGTGSILYDRNGHPLLLTFFEIRHSMSHGRNGYAFCKNCDSVDIGYSFNRVKDVLRSLE